MQLAVLQDQCYLLETRMQLSAEAALFFVIFSF